MYATIGSVDVRKMVTILSIINTYLVYHTLCFFGLIVN